MNNMRFAMGIEYEGSRYHGFQQQLDIQLPTIQAELEKAISAVANHAVKIVVAGRTDAGVHAVNQVIHFDTKSVRAESAWVQGVNAYLPKDISIIWIKPVNQNFHARFSAVARKYQYVILNARARSPLFHQRATLIYPELNHENMHKAAQYFVGEHDFSAFRSSQCQSKTPFRQVNDCRVMREKKFVFIEISANAFLHHMVRNMAGVLIEIGKNKRDVIWAKHVLESKDRRCAGVTAPADGLYLVEVKY